MVKAGRLEISRVEEGAKSKVSINDLFPFMGDMTTSLQRREYLIGMFYAGYTTKKMVSAKPGHD